MNIPINICATTSAILAVSNAPIIAVSVSKNNKATSCYVQYTQCSHALPYIRPDASCILMKQQLIVSDDVTSYMHRPILKHMSP